MKWWEWALWALFNVLEFVLACVGLIAFAVIGFIAGTLLYFAWDAGALWIVGLCGIGVVAFAIAAIWLIELSDRIAIKRARIGLSGGPGL